MDSFERFNEKHYLLENIFFSSIKKGNIGDDGKISDGHISVKNYLTCENIWDKFEMKNMGNYHNNYLKKDVLKLAGDFEKFIGTCFKYHGLDPCHYFSSAGLSWDAILKMTGVKLKKTSDIGKYLLIEKGLREGTSYIVTRYTKANNKYMNDYDPKKQSTFISYLEMKNLYGLAMSEYLPYEEFKWLKNVLDVMSINEKNAIGYLLQVDVQYPDKLHELYNDYPLAPEKLTVSSDVLSKYCKKIADEYKIKVGDVKN